MEEIYTRTEYIKLLSTYSNIIALEKSVRERFLNCIGMLIDQHFNGQIRKCHLTELIVAKKK